MTRLSVMVFVCAVVVLAGSCKNRTQRGKPLPVAASSAVGWEAARDRSQRSAKLDGVIKCFNRATRINMSADRYFQRLRGRSPRPGRTPSILFKPLADTSEVCAEAKAAIKPPIPQIDAIMPQYVLLVASLSRQLDDMDAYYRTKAFKGDGYKRGKEMHAAFEKDYDAFKKLHDRLSAAIDAAADLRDDESIAREAKGKGLRYYSLVFLRDAKYLSREITKDKPDEKKFAALRVKTETSYKAWTDDARAHPEQVDKAFMFGMYRTRADAFVRSVRDADAARLSQHDLDEMINRYNAMIDASNVVHWTP